MSTLACMTGFLMRYQCRIEGQTSPKWPDGPDWQERVELVNRLEGPEGLVKPDPPRRRTNGNVGRYHYSFLLTSCFGDVYGT